MFSEKVSVLFRLRYVKSIKTVITPSFNRWLAHNCITRDKLINLKCIISLNRHGANDNGRYFADDNFQIYFLERKPLHFIQMPLKFALNCSISNNSVLVRFSARFWTCDRPLPELAYLPLVTHKWDDELAHHRFSDAYMTSMSWLIIGSANGLSPVRRHAITWTNAGLLLTGLLGTNFSEIRIEILSFSLKKTHLKFSSAKTVAILSGGGVW